MPKVEGLTDKQRRFVEEYCVDFNATQAAIRAGYSEHTARAIGSENLSKPDIRDALEERMDALAMSAGEATMRLTEWGRGSLKPFLDEDGSLNLTTEEAKAAVGLLKKAKISERIIDTGYSRKTVLRTTEVELHDAKDAVIQMAKVRGLYTDKVEHSGPGGTPLIIRMVDE